MILAALVTPLSGPLADYGRAGAIALKLWTHWDADRVDLEVFDAHPDPAAAIRQAECRRPDLLFGPYGSSPTLAAAQATSRLVWNHGGARAAAANNLISILAPADTYFSGAIQAIHQVETGCRVCVLHGDTGFGRAVGQGATREAERLGMQVARRALPAEPTDAEILLVAGSFADEVAVARKSFPGRWRAAGFVGAGVEEVLPEIGDRREGLLGPAQWVASAAPAPDEGPPATQFVSTYRRTVGSEPPYPAAQAFAAGLIASRCLRESGTTEDTALAAAAEELDCTTMFARFKLDQQTRRQVGHRVLTVQWQQGLRRVVWPPERAQAALRYPLT